MLMARFATCRLVLPLDLLPFGLPTVGDWIMTPSFLSSLISSSARLFMPSSNILSLGDIVEGNDDGLCSFVDVLTVRKESLLFLSSLLRDLLSRGRNTEKIRFPVFFFFALPVDDIVWQRCVTIQQRSCDCQSDKLSSLVSQLTRKDSRRVRPVDLLVEISCGDSIRL